jgi:hypothetical protein
MNPRIWTRRRTRSVGLATISTVGLMTWARLSDPASAQTSCALQLATSPLAFCDTFDAPAGIGNRSGDLNGRIWGVSRILGDTNFGQGTANAAPPTSLVGCDGTATVLPPHDVIVCNGQLREATNDNASGEFEAGTVTVLAMYPKQPFDFAGRTGTIGFDVSNDTHGTHAAWPELWVTDKPVPGNMVCVQTSTTRHAGPSIRPWWSVITSTTIRMDSGPAHR